MANTNPNPTTKKVAFEGTIDVPTNVTEAPVGLLPRETTPVAVEEVKTVTVAKPPVTGEHIPVVEVKEQEVHDDRHPVAPENNLGSRMSARRIRLADGETMRP